MKTADVVQALMDYEDGRLGEEETVALFQALIDTGMVGSMQGHYGRTARELVAAGLCSPPKRTVDDSSRA